MRVVHGSRPENNEPVVEAHTPRGNKQIRLCSPELTVRADSIKWVSKKSTEVKERDAKASHRIKKGVT